MVSWPGPPRSPSNRDPENRNAGVRVVDNRVFVLGLDELYRDAMTAFEVRTLLPCARAVAAALHVQPAGGPVEGYYHESPTRAEYFQWMRSLQQVGESAEAQVRHLREFQLLGEVTSSSLFGRPQRNGKLFPVGRDPLSQALLDLAPHWSVERLVKAAYSAAQQYDDISLVGLAARVQDALVLAAARESTMLYEEWLALGADFRPEFRYEWRVDGALAEPANRFITIFNRFVPAALPTAEASHAERYYQAYRDNDVFGRCVRLGQTQDGSRHYHWAIARMSRSGDEFRWGVDEFWSEHVWTTEKYRRAHDSPHDVEPSQADGDLGGYLDQQ